MRRSLLVAAALHALISLPAASEDTQARASADQSTSYLFGQSAALSGPASALGTGMHGRRLELTTLDDAYGRAGLRAGPEATPAAFLETLRQTSDIDLEGFELGFGPSDNQGSDQVYLTVIDRNGQVWPVRYMATR